MEHNICVTFAVQRQDFLQGVAWKWAGGALKEPRVSYSWLLHHQEDNFEQCDSSLWASVFFSIK